MQMRVGDTAGPTFVNPNDQSVGKGAPGVTPSTTPSGNLNATEQVQHGAPPRMQSEPSETPVLEDAEDATPDLRGVTAKMLAGIGGGVNLQEIFKELLEVGRTLKTAGRIDREAHVSAVETKSKAAAEEMRVASWFSLGATLVAATAQIVGAGISLTGAKASQSAFDEKFKSMLQPKPDGQGGTLPLQPTDVQIAADSARQAAASAGAVFNFGATLSTEGGKVLGAGGNIVAQYIEAHKAELQADSQRESSRAEDDSEFKQAAEKMIATVMDKMSEIERAQAQTMSSIARIGG
ncbi:MAG: hypothetical protein WDN25_15185 [Acetobacteraceae bacterium]